MHQLEVSLFLLMCSSSFLIANKVEEFQSIYIVSARCNMSEKFYYQNFSCFAKSYSRTYSTLNIISTSKMPFFNILVRHFDKIYEFGNLTWNNFKIEIKVFFRYGLVFREVITTPKIDVCEVTHQIGSNQKLSNRVIFAVFRFIKDSYPAVVHECPYYVRENIRKMRM